MKVLAAAILLMLPVCAAAQPADPATRELIEKLLARIDGLEKRVAELEGAKAPPNTPAVPAPAAQHAPPEPMAAHTHDQPPVPPAGSPETVQPSYPYLKLAGFADI